MRGRPDPIQRAACIRLRIEEHLSLREIAERTGVSKGSLSAWLREHPLSPDVLKQKLAVRSYRAPKKERGTESALHQLVPLLEQSRHWKAKMAEAATMLRLVMFGFHPFGSMFDGDKTDWLVEDPDTGRTHKIQVKWAAPDPEGLPLIRLKCHTGHSKQRKYHAGEFDFVVGYNYFTDTCYVWSWGEVEGMSCKTIEPSAAEAWHKLKGR